VPDTGVLFGPVKVNVEEVTVLAFNALLNVALTVVPALTPVALLAGVIAVTLSGGGGALVTVNVVLPVTCP
jgi:hypothetical protein